MKEITDSEFWHIVQYIKKNYGVNLIHKKTLIIGRLQNYLQQNGFTSFSEYFEHVLSDSTGKAGETLINKLTTNHTFFMREREHYDYFQSVVLPFWAAKASKQMDLRIWSAGCSSGQEPYTLAMLVDHYFGSSKALWDTQILATDISTRVLEIALEGVYLNEDITLLPQNFKHHYFQSVDTDHSKVVERIRREVIFRKFNLMSTQFPFKRQFHAIFCRNVMIYFDAATKQELVNKFYDFTEPGGYLFVGHSESINRNETGYRYIMPAVYRKE